MPARLHPLGWPNALHPSRSPCRIDRAKGVHQHRCSASHADRVESHHLWREIEERVAEETAIGYATELEEYWKTHERPTFARFLRDMRESRDDEAEAA